MAVRAIADDTRVVHLRAGERTGRLVAGFARRTGEDVVSRFGRC
jgi:hypothetical protein